MVLCLSIHHKPVYCSVKIAEQIELVFGTQATLHVSYSGIFKNRGTSPQNLGQNFEFSRFLLFSPWYIGCCRRCQLSLTEDSQQFIIISHNIGTVGTGDCLYVYTYLHNKINNIVTYDLILLKANWSLLVVIIPYVCGIHINGKPIHWVNKIKYLSVYLLCNTDLTDITDAVRTFYGKFNNINHGCS